MSARRCHVHDSAATGPVLCTADDIIPEHDHTSPCGRRRGLRAAAGAHQHDAGRFAEPVAEIDAMAGAAAVYRHRHHDAHGLGDGALEHDPEKWVPVFRKDHAQTKT